MRKKKTDEFNYAEDIPEFVWRQATYECPWVEWKYGHPIAWVRQRARKLNDAAIGTSSQHNGGDKGEGR